ncbi:Protein of unknown function [Pyronema omphalodes CBS 100304]|uniref:Uncharacterized protein n=1 Tax=Pyronema omphalodes (strain CBS 100304) TaxID=1076935 RepID=U4KUH4_PYROM|nr:Protein of unknown function [Pyronema omphalodes CBS 100304]
MVTGTSYQPFARDRAKMIKMMDSNEYLSERCWLA